MISIFFISPKGFHCLQDSPQSILPKQPHQHETHLLNSFILGMWLLLSQLALFPTHNESAAENFFQWFDKSVVSWLLQRDVKHEPFSMGWSAWARSVKDVRFVSLMDISETVGVLWQPTFWPTWAFCIHTNQDMMEYSPLACMCAVATTQHHPDLRNRLDWNLTTHYMHSFPAPFYSSLIIVCLICCFGTFG